MLRWNLVVVGAPVGLAVGLIAWLAAGGATAKIDKMTPLVAAAAGLHAPARSGDYQSNIDVGALAAAPLFALTVGPGAIKEPSIRLEGVSVSRRRTAALVSIDGRPAEWWGIGESRDGVTLQAVQSSRIVVDTILGPREIALGEQIGPATPEVTAQAEPPVQPAMPDRMPSGFRSPLPPASAPK